MHTEPFVAERAGSSLPLCTRFLMLRRHTYTYIVVFESEVWRCVLGAGRIFVTSRLVFNFVCVYGCARLCVRV